MNSKQRPFYKDASFWVLISSNGITIAYGLKGDLPFDTIVTVYWVQSVIIGIFNVMRIMSLKEFSTEGVQMNDHSVEPTEKTKRSVTSFFALHYGFFHAIYAVFLFTKVQIDIPYLLFGSAVFFIDHFFSFVYNRKADEKKIRNIGRLMFFPYARIIPMHLVILVSGVFASGTELFFFLALKTLADLIMHVVEHTL